VTRSFSPVDLNPHQVLASVSGEFNPQSNPWKTIHCFNPDKIFLAAVFLKKTLIFSDEVIDNLKIKFFLCIFPFNYFSTIIISWHINIQQSVTPFKKCLCCVSPKNKGSKSL